MAADGLKYQLLKFDCLTYLLVLNDVTNCRTVSDYLQKRKY